MSRSKEYRDAVEALSRLCQGERIEALLEAIQRDRDEQGEAAAIAAAAGYDDTLIW